jgi:Fic family protein
VSIIVLLLIVIFGVILVGGLIWAVKEDYKDTSQKNPNLIEKQAQKKAEHLEKIKEFIKGKETVVNNDIQKFLGVSDATATRYLDELEKQGILRQNGERKGVYYEKIR